MASRDVRPVHVEFDRCGRRQPGGGWTRCKTAHLCQYHGCQVMQAEEIRERAEGTISDGQSRRLENATHPQPTEDPIGAES